MANGKNKPETKLQRFRRRIKEQYWVRFHMMLILMATTVSGIVASRVLLWCGIGSVTVRYPLNVAIAYLVFLGLVRLWIVYVHSGSSGPDLDIDLDGADVGETDIVGEFTGSMPGTGGSSPGGGGGGGGGSWFSFDGFDLDGEGALILIVLGILVLVILSAGAYLIWVAPEILGEAAFNAVLAANLVKVSNRLEREGWVEGVVRATVVPFGIVMVMTCVLAYVVHHSCPVASTVREALSCPTPVTSSGSEPR